MIAWYWVLIAILLTNAVTSFTYEYFEWSNLWVDFLAGLAIIVLYIPLGIYHICFKNTLHPITTARLEELRALWAEDECVKIRHLGKGLYFCTDPKASKLWNKIFFLVAR